MAACYGGQPFFEALIYKTLFRIVRHLEFLSGVFKGLIERSLDTFPTKCVCFTPGGSPSGAGRRRAAAPAGVAPVLRSASFCPLGSPAPGTAWAGRRAEWCLPAGTWPPRTVGGNSDS